MRATRAASIRRRLKRGRRSASSLDRTGQRIDALAAASRATALEPDNWRHHFRLAYVSWGEARLRAAHRTLALLPGFPLAHWLAATVHVARQALDEAERELGAGLASDLAHGRFGAVALHWLRGLVMLAGGDEGAALAEFERELAGEAAGHMYSRECCANTWYAIGALRLRQGRRDEAADAFARAIDRIPHHPLALAALNRDLVAHIDPPGVALAAAIRLALGGGACGRRPLHRRSARRRQRRQCPVVAAGRTAPARQRPAGSVGRTARPPAKPRRLTNSGFFSAPDRTSPGRTPHHGRQGGSS